MPPLRNLVCQVEWDSADNPPLQEYDTAYGDGFVESYLAIPRNPTQFVIHLTSQGYIAPGLAMYVFIDGEYQCNRNRHRLFIPAEGVSRKDCEIDFRLRQKEYSRSDGTWEGQQWKFEKVTPGSNADEDEHAASVGEYGGKIEVLVLRCYHSNPSRRSSSSMSLSTTSNESSRRSSYMDDQRVPIMIGAISDGAGDSPPPPGHHRPLGRSRERAKKESLPTLGLRGGGAAPPQSAYRRSRQCCQEGEQTNASRFRFGGGLFYSAESRDPSSRPQERTEQQSPPTLGLRGGAGSQGKPSKKGTPSPAPSSKSYRSGSGDLPSRTKTSEGSTGSYTPEDTWRTRRPKKSKNGSTGSYTPDSTRESGGTAHRDNQGQTEGMWTWEPGNSIPTSFSTHRRKENKQGSVTSTSSIKRDTKPTKTWNPAGENKDKENQEDENCDINDNHGDEKWDSNNNDDDQQGDDPDTTGHDSNDQLENGWGAVDRHSNNDQNGDQNDDWGNANKYDKDRANAHGSNMSNWNDPKVDSDTGNDQHNDKNNDWGADISDTIEQSKWWDKAGATTPHQNIADESRSQKVPRKAVSPADGTKAQNIQGKVSRPPSILTPATKLTGSKGIDRRIPSNASLKSALKSPFKSWASAKALPTTISDKVVKKSAAMPGAWSPPLEKAEKKSRSESTKRRAAEFNAERAKSREAELDIESLKARSQRSRPATPLSSSVLKPVSEPSASTPLTYKSKIFQTHRKRPSTVVEEAPGAVDVMKDHGPTHEARPLSPASYTHKTCTPHYMDTIANPYAHFVFHYRDMAFISKMCNITIVETREQLRSRLASLTKQELLELLIEEKLAAEEEADENLTWRTSPDKAGYKPNLNAANEKLDEWGNNKTSSGESDGANKDGRGNGIGNINDSGDVDTSNGSQDIHNQGGDSWGNGDEGHSGDAGWGEWGIRNDNSGENTGWGDSNVQSGNNENPFGGSNRGEGEGGW